MSLTNSHFLDWSHSVYLLFILILVQKARHLFERGLNISDRLLELSWNCSLFWLGRICHTFRSWTVGSFWLLSRVGSKYLISRNCNDQGQTLEKKMMRIGKLKLTMICLMLIDAQLSDCWIEGCPLSFIFHEQKVIGSSTLDLEVTDPQMLIAILISCWVI